MVGSVFSWNPAESQLGPSDRAVPRLIGVLQTATALSKRLAVIGRLGDRLVEGPLADPAPILEALCAFIRVHAPVAGPRSLHSSPAKDVQAALNVLAARPRREGPSGNEFALDLSDTDLTGAWLASGRFRGARFDRSSLRMVDLSYADLEQASFRDADLGGATLAHSRLTGADFRGARLHNVDLTGAALAESGGFMPERALAS